MDTGSDRAGKPGVVAERVLAQGRYFAFVELEIASRSGAAHTNQVVRHPGAVTILPLREQPGEQPAIVFVEVYRAAVDRRLLELPAGKLERGEDPASCAGRELIEETGYQAGRIDPIFDFFTTPGLTNERMHAFLARDLRHVGQALEDDEDILVREVPVAEAVRMAVEGRIEDAKSALTILLAHGRGLLGAMP